VALDWFGGGEPDIAIAVQEQVPVRARRESHVGLEFSIIRQQILRQPPVEPRQGVVVVMGGGDALGQGRTVAEQLRTLGLNVTLIEGPLVNTKPANQSFNLMHDPSNFSEILAGCAWAVTNGGGCMLEALFLDTPTVVLPQTQEELALATALYDKGGLLALGSEGIRSYSTSQLRDKRGVGPALIDGEGVVRVAQIVEALCHE
jgi:spore coat polysaccharide biosynthesis predicted glycosyltransferase SpsG